MILLDGPLVIGDGYDIYAEFLSVIWQSDSVYFDHPLIDNVERHRLRIMYPFSIYLLNFIIKDVVISGIIISLISSIGSLIVLEKICSQLDFSNSATEIILILMISNITLIQNFARFETDMFFMLLFLFAFYYFLIFIKQPDFENIRLLLLFSLLSFLTREIGLLLIVTIILWSIYPIIAKFIDLKPDLFLLLTILVTILGTIVGIILAQYSQLIYSLMFDLIWAAGTEEVAGFILNGNIGLIYFNIITKLTFKTLEAMTYLFSQLVLFILIELYLRRTNSRHEESSQILSNRVRETQIYSIISFIIIFYAIYFFLKLGRTLDRFFISTIPLILIVCFYFLSEKSSDKSLLIAEKKKIMGLIISWGFGIYLLRLILGFFIRITQ